MAQPVVREIFQHLSAGDFDQVMNLVKRHNINPNLSHDDQSMAMIGVQQGQAGFLEFLGEQGGFDPNQLIAGRTLLHEAADARVAEALIRMGADPKARGSYPGWETQNVTPLHLAIQRLNQGTAEVLLKAQEPGVNLRDASGTTALHYAGQRLPEMVVPLIKSGANADIRDLKGRFPSEFMDPATREVMRATISERSKATVEEFRHVKNRSAHESLQVALRQGLIEMQKGLLESPSIFSRMSDSARRMTEIVRAVIRRPEAWASRAASAMSISRMSSMLSLRFRTEALENLVRERNRLQQGMTRYYDLKGLASEGRIDIPSRRDMDVVRERLERIEDEIAMTDRVFRFRRDMSPVEQAIATGVLIKMGLHKEGAGILPMTPEDEDVHERADRLIADVFGKWNMAQELTHSNDLARFHRSGPTFP
jgi:ankyrin repeat protein